MKRMVCAGLVLLMCVIFYPKISYADKGGIYPRGVTLSERAQKAIIFHNFKEEILILGTDFDLNKKTKFVTFIPFPSEPDVSIVKTEPFKRVSEIIRKKKIYFRSLTKGGGSAGSVSVLFDAKLDAHEITVIKLNDINSFREWVLSFLSTKGLSDAGNLTVVENIARDYISRGFKYFVFDIVEATPEQTSVKPLAYRFKTDKLYYPLKTSNTFGGDGEINLIIISPGTVCTPWFSSTALYEEIKDDIPQCLHQLEPYETKGYSHWLRVSTSDFLSLEEISSIHPQAQELFQSEGGAFLQVFRSFTQYNFSDDIYIDISGIPPKAYNLDSKRWHPWVSPSPWWYKEIRDQLKQKTFVDKIKNSAYRLAFSHRTVTLNNGKHEQPFPDYLKVWIERFLISDLNNDGMPDAVVVLGQSGGGSGAFYELTALISKKDGSVFQTNSISLGNRVKIENLIVVPTLFLPTTELTILLDILTHKENDPSCCPSKNRRICFRFSSDKLISCDNASIDAPIVRKPAIYLYPERTEKVEVKLDVKGRIIGSEPNYENG